MPVPRAPVERLVAFVAGRQHRKLGTVDVAIVGRRRMTVLNRRFLGHLGATDVLSFDLSDGQKGPLSAQIIVCWDVAVAQGRHYGVPARRELLLYVVHGLLHVMGFDDAEPKAAEKMRARQESLLEAFLRSEP